MVEGLRHESRAKSIRKAGARNGRTARGTLGRGKLGVFMARAGAGGLLRGCFEADFRLFARPELDLFRFEHRNGDAYEGDFQQGSAHGQGAVLRCCKALPRAEAPIRRLQGPGIPESGSRTRSTAKARKSGQMARGHVLKPFGSSR